MRELYVISGLHSTLLDVNTKGQNMSVRLCLDLVGSIAIAKGCTGYFSEMTPEEEIDEANDMIEIYKDNQALAARLVLEDRSLERSTLYEGMHLFETLSGIREHGIEIKFLPTEPVTNPLELLRNRLNPKDYTSFVNSYAALREYWKNRVEADAVDGYVLQSIYDAYDPYICSILTAARDSNIFKSVLACGHDRNILDVGRNHKLKDFKRKEHDFKFYRVNLNIAGNDRIKIIGRMPKDLEQLFTDLGRFYSADVAVKFKDL